MLFVAKVTDAEHGGVLVGLDVGHALLEAPRRERVVQRKSDRRDGGGVPQTCRLFAF